MEYPLLVKLEVGVYQRITPSGISMLCDHYHQISSYESWKWSSSLVESWTHDDMDPAVMIDQVWKP